MYEYSDMPELVKSTEAATTKPIHRYGVGVYVECDPDVCGYDIYIDPLDLEGIAIFRRFAAEFTAHLKTLKIKS